MAEIQFYAPEDRRLMFKHVSPLFSSRVYTLIYVSYDEDRRPGMRILVHSVDQDGRTYTDAADGLLDRFATGRVFWVSD